MLRKLSKVLAPANHFIGSPNNLVRSNRLSVSTVPCTDTGKYVSAVMQIMFLNELRNCHMTIQQFHQR